MKMQLTKLKSLAAVVMAAGLALGAQAETPSDSAIVLTNRTGEVLSAPCEPGVQLGVVAQRYPWNGTLDVEYRATCVNDAPATLTVAANGREYAFDVTVSTGVHTLAVTVPADIQAKDAKVTLKLK